MASLIGFSDKVVSIDAPSFDNLGADPVLLNLSTSYGNVPRGYLLTASNRDHRFELSNSGTGFARLYRGTFIPAATRSGGSRLFPVGHQRPG